MVINSRSSAQPLSEKDFWDGLVGRSVTMAFIDCYCNYLGFQQMDKEMGFLFRFFGTHDLGDFIKV